MNETETQNPNSAVTGNTGDQNGVPRGILGPEQLAGVFQSRGEPAAPESNPPGQTDSSGQPETGADSDNLDDPANVTQPAEVGQTEAGEDESDLSQSESETENTVEESGEGEGEGEAEADPDLEHHGLKKRLRKLSATVRELRELLEKQQQQAKDEPAPEAAAAPANAPLPHVKTQQELKQLKREAFDAQRWCRRNPQGGVFAGKEYDENGVLDLQDKVDSLLEFDIPDQEKVLEQQAQVSQARAQNVQLLRQTLPELADPESAPARKVAAELKKFPFLNQFLNPEAEAYMRVLGREALQARLKPAAAPANKGKPAPKPRTATPVVNGSRTGAAPRQTPGMTVKSALDKHKRDRSVSALAAVLKALDGGRQN